MLYERCLQPAYHPQCRQGRGRAAKDQRQRYDPTYSVGFQSRFQTAGTLIFKPPEQSTLAVNGIRCPIQNRNGSIRIMMSMIGPKDRTISKSKRITTTLGSRKDWKESRTNGRKRVRRHRNSRKVDCIIRKCRSRTREIPTGTYQLTQTRLQPHQSCIRGFQSRTGAEDKGRGQGSQ